MVDRILTLKLNNPGNLYYDSNDNYATGNNGGYAVYLKPEQGIAALAQVFQAGAKQGQNTSEKLCAYFLKISRTDSKQVALVARYMRDNAGIEPQQVPDLTDPLTMLAWISNFISLLNSGPVFTTDDQIRGCALALGISTENFARAVQPKRYAWQNGVGIAGDQGFVNPASSSLVSGASSLQAESTNNDQLPTPPSIYNDPNSVYFWEEKDLHTHLQQTEPAQTGTSAYGTAQLFDPNQGISQVRREQVVRQISDIDDQILSEQQKLKSTSDQTAQAVIQSTISDLSFRRQSLVEQRVALDSQYNSATKTTQINNTKASTTYNQRDSDAALIQTRDVQQRTQLIADAYQSQASQPFQTSINDQAQATQKQRSVSHRNRPIGGGYVPPATGSQTPGRSVFGKPVLIKPGK